MVPASCFESFDIRELRELAEAWAVHELSRVAVLSAAMTAPFPLENQRNPSPVKTLTRFALPLLAYLASGCGLTDPDIPEIAGKWTGTDNDGDRWELELTETPSAKQVEALSLRRVRISGVVSESHAISEPRAYLVADGVVTDSIVGVTEQTLFLSRLMSVRRQDDCWGTAE